MKTCPICEKSLNPKRVNQKYHLGECAQEAERKRRRIKRSRDSRIRNEYGQFTPQHQKKEVIFEEKAAECSLNIEDISCTETKYDGERLVLVPFSDLHYGHKNCDVKAIEEYVRWMEGRDDVFTFLNGDQMENVIVGSKGNIFEQISPQKQIDYLTDLFSKLAEQGKVIGLRRGNHEQRTLDLTGIDPAKILASNLNVPYLSATSFHRFTLGKQEYLSVSEHGSTSSRTSSGKTRAIERMAETYDADIYIQGHSHDTDTKTRPYIGRYGEEIGERKRIFVNAGYFLDYFGTYADRGGFPPGKKGAVKIKLYRSKWMIHTGT